MRTVSSQAFLRCALVVAVVGLAAYFGHSAFGLGGRACGTFFDVYVASGLSMFAAIVCFAGARTRRGDRPAWMLAAAGLGSWSVGDVIFHALYTGDNPAVPSLADLFYSAMYPALALAIVLVARRRLHDLGLWLDGIVAGLTLIAVLFALGYAPISTRPRAMR